MIPRTVLLAASLAAPLATTCAAAQMRQPAPDAAAARRFPQPVRVADLLHRAVLRPVESQDVLGHVRQVVRAPDGTLEIVIAYGGLLGVGARPVAVPADAMVLVGQVMEVVDLKPAQLDRLPTFRAADAAPVPPEETVRIGIDRPSH